MQGDTVSSNTILIPVHYPPSWLVPNQRKGLAAIDFPSEARSEIQCSNIRHQNLILLRQDTKKHPDLSTLVEKKSPYYEDWFLIHMRSHVLMLSRLIVLHILSVSLTRICSGAAGDSAASPHSSLPGKIISGEANGKHPAILQDISAVYLTSPKHFYKARRY